MNYYRTKKQNQNFYKFDLKTSIYILLIVLACIIIPNLVGLP